MLLECEICLAMLIIMLCHCGYSHINYDTIADQGNYTCDELTRWLGTEKHYSNDKKTILFGHLANQDCRKVPVVLINDIAFGFSGGKRSYFKNSQVSSCADSKRLVVTFLSNFSINNNFSHFLHGLLRLFCALIDARWIVWHAQSARFTVPNNYTIWLDENFKLSKEKMDWIRPLGSDIHWLRDVKKGQCYGAKQLLYGSGCVKLLPPEKWFGYPGCRAKEVLPAFGEYMRQRFMAASAADLLLIDELSDARLDPGLRVAFAVRSVGSETGRRAISNLGQVQTLLRSTQHIRTSTENITFEHLDVPSTVRLMSGVHIFVSVHGAAMTNMFFMNPGSAVVEIIPFPLCNCRSPDYFYGVGGYYQGSAVAQGIKHYHYCVPAQDVVWHEVPSDLKEGGKCSWKHLHSVESIFIEPTRFVSLMRNVERDLVVAGTIVLTRPIINMSPNANGR